MGNARLRLGCIVFCSLTAVLADERPRGPADPAVDVYDSETSQESFLTPEEARQSITTPDGFAVSVFAAEPNVRQPIAMAFDERGRLWVAENYTYAESALRFDRRLNDRVVILEDTDGDGQADVRKVFWDQAKTLTSVEIGYGGVWALSDGKLLFVPDSDRDDTPDGDPVVLLDGWDQLRVRHNIVNGLRWGPDGWLYGRHGILATSFVGRPGTPREARTPINCGLWRFHPVTHAFETVVHGTTNSWGHDWDEHGELFFINTVIGHLWHAVPGAHFVRMYGEDLNPHVYELIPQIADHLHWDSSEKWHEIRELGLTQGTSEAGGGHAHSGLLIYQGDQWPREYRGDVFTANLHGRRVNRDRLARRGSGFVGRHRPDLLTVGDIWFRGLDLMTGPEGAVYLNDWSDVGECHDSDGVHRTSGRIYRISYGEARPQRGSDLASAPNAALVGLQFHPNEWWVRQSRRLLQERAAGGADMSEVHRALLDVFRERTDVHRQLRALWALYVTGGAQPAWLAGQLGHENEFVRVQAVRLLVDQGAPPAGAIDRLAALARTEPSGLVLAHLASALQKVPRHARWQLAEAIASRQEYENDPMLSRLVWYGIESAVLTHVGEAIALAASSRLGTVRRLIARRLTEEIRQRPSDVNRIAELVTSERPASFQLDIVQGMDAALAGWHRAEAPSGWTRAAPLLFASADSKVREHARNLAVIFGDGRALEELRSIVDDQEQTGNARRSALRALIQSRAEGLVEELEKFTPERTLGATAIRGLGAFGNPKTPEILLQHWAKLRHQARAAAVDVLVARDAFARDLLAAVASASIDREEIPVYQVRRMRYLKDPVVQKRLDALWPELRVPPEKQSLVERYSKTLAPELLAGANLDAGKQLFTTTCAPCHKLLGAGGDAGPDLTGAQRANLNYLVLNLVDPNAEVADSYRASVVALKDGRILSGVIGKATRETLALRTPTEERVLERDAILSIERTESSIMPEGLLETLKDAQKRDLIAYLMTAR